MATKNDKFMKCMKIVFENEGGYVNNPNDSGKETNMGITAATLKDANKYGITKIKDVKKLTRSVCEDIYFAMYWCTSKCDDFEEPLDLMVFDTAVHSGPSQAIKFLQQSINKILNGRVLVVDGLYGKNSKNYVTKCTSDSNHTKLLCKVYLDIREQFLRDLCIKKPKNKVFLTGWMNRINKLRDLINK